MSTLPEEGSDSGLEFPAVPTTRMADGIPRVVVEMRTQQIAVGVFLGIWSFAITLGALYAVVRVMF